MRIVLDTNVLVSAALSRSGFPYEVTELVFDREVETVVDEQILREYREVMNRSRLGIDPHIIKTVMAFFEMSAVRVDVEPLSVELPDPSDRMFMEVAISGLADCIVTGNKRHFPAKACRGVRILSPAEFIREFPQRK